MFIKSFKVFESELQLESIVNKYLQESRYNIQKSTGNCAFFAKDFFEWSKNNNIDCKLYYLKQDYTGQSEVEDHIVPVVNNKIIDFVWTPEGVSRRVRQNNPEAVTLQTNPHITDIVEFKNEYEKWGYFTIEEITYEEAFGKNGKCLTIEYPDVK